VSSPPGSPIFENYGGYYHLRIASAEDLKHLLTLNDGRWLATSCPRSSLNADPTFLHYLDADGNGRIVSEEVRAAIRWTWERLHPSPTWTNRQPTLPLSLIRSENPEGKALLAAARRILETLRRPEATEITLDEIRNRQTILAQAVYNGDGVIPPDAIEDPSAAEFARDLVNAYGGSPDASGRNGVDLAHLDRFAAEAKAYLEWHAAAQREAPHPILPYGDATQPMFDALTALREPVERFYAQCALVRFDPRVLDLMRLRDDELDALSTASREALLERLRQAPLATPNAEGLLPLEGVNEAYAEPMRAFRERVVRPILGDLERLSEPEWRALLAHFAPYERWIAAKPTTPLEALGVEKLRRYLDSPHDRTIRAMIETDRAVASELEQMQNLEKLLLYHQWLWEFANNYASFPRLFSLRERALFERGTLILDAREYSLALRVENRPAHANLAKHAGLFLLYAQITGAQPSETFEVVVPVTRGNSIGLYVGRRGVFYSLDGKEYDAEITQMIENPINLWESMKEPIRRIRDLIAARTEQLAQTVQKTAESQVAKVSARVETGVQPSLQVASSPAPSPAASPEAASKTSGNVRDLMIGAGFVFAGLATSVKFLADTAAKLQQPGALRNLLYLASATVGGLFFILMAVTTLTAWMKLRKRDLGVLLQACGWAINGRIRVTAKMGRLFVRPVRLPRHAQRRRRDLISSLRRSRSQG